MSLATTFWRPASQHQLPHAAARTSTKAARVIGCRFRRLQIADCLDRAPSGAGADVCRIHAGRRHQNTSDRRGLIRSRGAGELSQSSHRRGRRECSDPILDPHQFDQAEIRIIVFEEQVDVTVAPGLRRGPSSRRGRGPPPLAREAPGHGRRRVVTAVSLSIYVVLRAALSRSRGGSPASTAGMIDRAPKGSPGVATVTPGRGGDRQPRPARVSNRIRQPRPGLAPPVGDRPIATACAVRTLPGET